MIYVVISVLSNTRHRQIINIYCIDVNISRIYL
nr:MAG TPA: hypothetical protein [Caudoviricetes sp.]